MKECSARLMNIVDMFK